MPVYPHRTLHDTVTKTGKTDTAGELLTPLRSPAVKTNPLLSREELPVERSSIGENGPENAVFYGQRTKIRRTKEQEMITAILELAEYGKQWGQLQTTHTEVNYSL